MRNLSQDDMKLLAQVGRHYPELGVLLTRVRADELEVLSVTSNDFFPVQKGRIGMLTDLLKHVMTQTP
jgi:hypothetical protein